MKSNDITIPINRKRGAMNLLVGIIAIICGHYIFNMEYNHKFECLKFATFIDLYSNKFEKKQKYILTFQVMNDSKKLRLIGINLLIIASLLVFHNLPAYSRTQF